MAREVMDMNGLELRAGKSFEQIREAIERMNLRFKPTFFGPIRDTRYFRSSQINISRENHDVFHHIGNVLGNPDRCSPGNGRDTYFGFYMIGREFDVSQLNGALTFKEGMLVEKTSIYYPD